MKNEYTLICTFWTTIVFVYFFYIYILIIVFFLTLDAGEKTAKKHLPWLINPELGWWKEQKNQKIRDQAELYWCLLGD